MRSCRIVLALCLALLTVPSAAGAGTWLHPGSDPARTGGIPFEGPAIDDVALEVQLPGAVTGTPIIRNGSAYLTTEAREDVDANLTEDALWRLDLADGTTQRIMELAGVNASIGPGLDLVVSAEDSAAAAQTIPDGETVWRVGLPYSGSCPDQEIRVGQTVFREGIAYVPMTNFCQQDGAPVQSISIVRAVKKASGDPVGWWTRSDEQIPFDLGQLQTSQGVTYTSAPVLSVADDGVYAAVTVINRTSVQDPRPGSDGTTWTQAREIQHELWSIDPEQTSEPRWHVSDTSYRMARVPGSGAEPGQGNDAIDAWTGRYRGGTAVVGDELVFIRLDEVNALNRATGDPVWTAGAGDADAVQVRGPTTIGLQGDTLVATSTQTVYRFDARTGEMVWQQRLETADLIHGTEPMAVSDEVAYVPWYQPSPDDAEIPIAFGIDARSLDTGELMWRWGDGPDVGPTDRMPSEPGFGKGFMVWGAPDGAVHVIGKTAASPEPVAEVSTRYPEPGDAVTVELSASQAGALGPVTAYGADWGDGSPLDEQIDPVLSHTFEEPGDVTARFVVVNDADQEASTFVTFQVGEPEPNWISQRFAPENQDLTFGVLGLLVAFTGGAIGVGRRYRKRSLLQDELEAMEHGVEELQDRPSECEAFLDTRKARARSLAIDGKLEEQQVTVLESRAEELRGSLRLEALQEEFAFLPHGLVTKARQMVTDGDVSALEREAFLAALEEDEMLTEAQRATVRERIERWYARDGGGGAGA